ncbi:unnamed protein product [Ostreobium quekettii]|uniref:Cilia- and flagella-associated protein 206 n=1 Tax=Ostreobium quekettii TaxID=121088 RepID=A0A8S1J842_9CHLO|nr:unnamed protein product [Ostreobium quekettii]
MAEMEIEMRTLLEGLQQTVGENSVVSKESVYPAFERLGEVHLAACGEQRLGVARQRILEVLEDWMRRLDELSPFLQVGDDSPHFDAPDLEDYEGPAIPDDLEAMESVSGAQRVSPADSPAREELALRGFCPVALVRRGGLLRRGDASLGCVRVGDATFTLSSAKARDLFAASPGEYRKGVAAAVRKEPFLAKLLGLLATLPWANVSNVTSITRERLSCDFGIQTPTHFEECHIDVDYEWNVWALRRRALELANLRGKATHSCQTHLSHFRRDGNTQVWRPKAASVQTPFNKGQCMPRRLRYVAGLRGGPDVKMRVVSLQLDVGQPHQY